MAKSVNCPSCGGDIPLASKATAMAECAYCGNTLVVNEEALRSVGKMALLADQESCLAVGYNASCVGRDILTLGRLQFRYDAGLWDEWWVQFVEDGSYAWISQDEEEYMLEMDVTAQTPQPPPFDDCQVGAHITIAGQTFVVEEKNEATMVGVQGELPFTVVPNEKMRYLDLGHEGKKATISYFEDGHYEAYVGKYLSFKELQPLFHEGGD